MPKMSQAAKRAQMRAFIAGIEKRLPRGKTYRVMGKAYSHRSLVAFFQAQVDALDAIEAARGALTAAVAKERVVARRIRPGYLTFRDAILHRFGFESTALADFGLQAPKKPGPKTVAAKAEGASKAKATREGRGQH